MAQSQSQGGDLIDSQYLHHTLPNHISKLMGKTCYFILAVMIFLPEIFITKLFLFVHRLLASAG